MRRHIWVVEQRDPKRSHLWNNGTRESCFIREKDAVIDARRSRGQSNEFGWGLEYRVAKYTPHDPLEHYRGGY
jgi:hypothetical protein